MFGRLKDYRRIATRYDKLARNFFSAAIIAAIVALDQVALAVGHGVIGDQGLSRGVARNDRLGAPLGEQLAQPVRVIGPVG